VGIQGTRCSQYCIYVYTSEMRRGPFDERWHKRWGARREHLILRSDPSSVHHSPPIVGLDPPMDDGVNHQETEAINRRKWRGRAKEALELGERGISPVWSEDERRTAKNTPQVKTVAVLPGDA